MTPNPSNIDSCPIGTIPYSIRQEDTLDKIAKLYNTTVERILAYNPELKGTNLNIGYRICVPASVQNYPACPSTNYYVVRTGDTLTSIAQYFNISAEQLLLSNYGISTSLYKDQILCLPVAPSPVQVGVHVANKTLDIYKNDSLLKRFKLLPVNPDISIPRGSFNVLSKQLDSGISEGARWLGLSQAGFGIRGINAPQFIIKLASKKDIVLGNEDISEVFNLIPVGTLVNVT